MRKVLNGMWWVKGNEQAKFTGRLKYAGGYRPSLEVYLMEYDFKVTRSVPDNCTIYGEVFGESKHVQAVTLLGCSAQDTSGRITVMPFIYKQQHIRVECVAIGMLLNDDEIAQLQCPEEVYLTCPGLDEYSTAHTLDYVMKDNIPEGRPYLVNDVDKIVYTQPEPFTISFDIGTIAISLGPSSTGRNITSNYLIHINLDQPTSETEVNSLIYDQLLSFLSIMAGRMEHFEKHNVTIHSDRTNANPLGIELSYGHIAQSTQETDYSMLESLLIGTEENLRKFATLLPKWRENFRFVKGLASQYMQMAEQRTELSMLQAFPKIESYALERLIEKNKKGMPGILSEVINCIADSYTCSDLYSIHFPSHRREHIADQLANFRHKRIHPKSRKKCKYSSAEAYRYIEVILRSIFLIEMDYPCEDVDAAISHWPQWHRLPKQPCLT